MNILFLNPPDTLSIEASVPNEMAISEATGFYPKLGMLWIIAYLERELGNMSHYLDAVVDGLDYSALGSEISRHKPDLVAMSVLTFNLLDVVKTVNLVKSIDPRIKVCLGGVHPSLYPLETLKLPGVDFIVQGEGERSFTLLIRALSSGAGSSRLNSIPGLGWKDGDQVHINQSPELIRDLDSLPHPARRFLDFRKYKHGLGRGGLYTTVAASRGCPFGCAFCAVRKIPHRFRSPAMVVDELTGCVEKGIGEFFFVDDNLVARRDYVIGLCEKIRERRLSIQFAFNARVDRVDEEMLDCLAAAGCYRIQYGVESATQRLLDLLEKGITIEQTRRAFKLTHQAGIETSAYAMIGIPTETRDEMQSTVDFLIELDADYTQICISTPYPETPLYHWMISRGMIPYDYWRMFAENPATDFKPGYWNPSFSDEELRTIREKSVHRFYGRPRYLLKRLAKIKSPEDLLIKFRLGKKVLSRLWTK